MWKQLWYQHCQQTVHAGLNERGVAAIGFGRVHLYNRARTLVEAVGRSLHSRIIASHQIGNGAAVAACVQELNSELAWQRWPLTNV